jgi:hypothetical protein
MATLNVVSIYGANILFVIGTVGTGAGVVVQVNVGTGVGTGVGESSKCETTGLSGDTQLLLSGF